MVRNICILIFLILAAGCTEKTKEDNHSVNLPGIPSDAFWSGRSGTTGHWFKIHYVNDHRNAAFISIYDAAKGELLVKKKFHLVCVGGNQFLNEDLEKQIDRWEDGKIYFKVNPENPSCYLL